MAQPTPPTPRPRGRPRKKYPLALECLGGVLVGCLNQLTGPDGARPRHRRASCRDCYEKERAWINQRLASLDELVAAERDATAKNDLRTWRRVEYHLFEVKPHCTLARVDADPANFPTNALMLKWKWVVPILKQLKTLDLRADNCHKDEQRIALFCSASRRIVGEAVYICCDEFLLGDDSLLARQDEHRVPGATSAAIRKEIGKAYQNDTIYGYRLREAKFYNAAVKYTGSSTSVVWRPIPLEDLEFPAGPMDVSD